MKLIVNADATNPNMVKLPQLFQIGTKISATTPARQKPAVLVQVNQTLWIMEANANVAAQDKKIL